MRTRTILALLGTALAATMSLAETPSRVVASGARSLGMGGAFVGLADDAGAIGWNPAGLPRLQRQEFAGGYITPGQYVSGYSTGRGAATIPVGDRQAIGAEFLYSGLSDASLSFSDMSISGSWGVTLTRAFSVGANANWFVPTSGAYNGRDYGKSRGLGFDAGALVEVGALVNALDGLRLGLVARDIGGTAVKWEDTGVSEDQYAMAMAAGLSYKLRDNFTVAADVDGLRTSDGPDGSARLGAEYVLANILALRGGFQRQLGDRSEMRLSGGVGLRWRGLAFDYAYESHPTLNPTQYVGLSFAYNPSYITIKDAHVRPTPLYRAMYRTYEGDAEFAEVTLKNTAQEPLRVRVGLTVPTLMREGQYHTQEVTLPPQSTRRVSLGVTVDDSLLLREAASYDNFVQPEVVVNYEQERQAKREARKLESLYVLGRNRMTWDEPLRVCSFVTPEHSSVVAFGDEAVRTARARRDEVFDRCHNLGTAMILFDAVGRYGVTYNPDQTTPYYKLASDTSNMRTIFDTVKYPVDTFRSHMGDCDDCTVLFISLCEQQNIPTALLDVFDPVWGHVYMMFDTGLTPAEALASGLFLSESEFVRWTDPGSDAPAEHAWIPVETTMFGHPFMDAWKAGLDEYREKAARNFIRPWSVAAGRTRFQAGTVDAYAAPFPPAGDVRTLVSADIARFLSRLELPPLAEPITAEKLYGRGVELIERTQYEQAIDHFTRSLALRSDYGDALNGRGVARNYQGGRVRFLSDDPARRRQEAETLWQDAVADFRAALRLNAREPGYWINLTISYQLLDDAAGMAEARRQAIALDPELAPVLDELKTTAQ